MAFGVPEKVDDYIRNWHVNSIDVDSTVKQAIDEMEAKNTDFLVVTRNGKPVHILKKHQIVLEVLKNPKATIQSIAGKLKPAVVVESGSPWYVASSKLSESTVLVVVDNKTKSPTPNMIGTISVYDMKWTKRE